MQLLFESVLSHVVGQERIKAEVIAASNDYHPRHYRIDDYANRTRLCMRELLDAWNKGSVMAYDASDLAKGDVEMAVMQLAVEGVMPGYHYRMSGSLAKEDFVFRFDPDDEYHEDYTIGIADRQYSTVLTHWDNDYEAIRHQLESIAYNREAEMLLGYDGSELIVKVKKVDVLSSVKTSKDGCYFAYDKFALVEIRPNAFLTGPILKGYCDLKQTIRTFYEELLLLAMGLPQQETDDCEPARMEAYNMFKSPIIERWIVGESNYTNRAEVRQVWVKNIIIICPDYDGVIMTCGNEYTDIGEYYDKEGSPIVMPELDIWLESVRQAMVDAAVGRRSDIDWKMFHDKGLELAQQLRSKLSADSDLWYESPFEDEGGVGSRRRLVYDRWGGW